MRRGLGRGGRRAGPVDVGMIRVEGDMVSISLIVENPGLKRALDVGSGRWCTRDGRHDVERCTFLHKKEVTTGDGKSMSMGTLMPTVFQLAMSRDPAFDILSDERLLKNFRALLQMDCAADHMLPIVHGVMSSPAPYTVSEEEFGRLQMECDAWVTRCSANESAVRAWEARKQEQLFDLAFRVCQRDPTWFDGREALRTTAGLQAVPVAKRREAMLYLRVTETEVADVEGGEGDEKVADNGGRFATCPMYHNGMEPLTGITVTPRSDKEIRMGYRSLVDLPKIVVDRPIPHELRGLHIRALFHLARADCMHALSDVVERVKEEGTGVLFERGAKRGGVNVDAAHMTFTGIVPHPHHGAVGRFICRRGGRSRRLKFMTGDLVILWSSEGVGTLMESLVGIVRCVEEERGEVLVSLVDVVRALQVVMSIREFVAVRCPTFYLPTAASLTVLLKREKEIERNQEPPLLSTCVTCRGADEPPLYLRGNPLIALGKFVTLRAGTPDEVRALDPWRGEKWSLQLEEETAANSDKRKALLDGTQLDALQHMFRNRVAIVQGTPGTGKSFVSAKFLQILLENRERLRIGPIVVMTYTHHALESVFESLEKLISRPEEKLGIFGVRDEKLKRYEVRLPTAPLDVEDFTRIVDNIDAIVNAKTLNMRLQNDIVKVMKTYGIPIPGNMEAWYGASREYARATSLEAEVEKLCKGIAGETGWMPPKTVQELEHVEAALAKGMWFGVVDIIPHLAKGCGRLGKQFMGELRTIRQRKYRHFTEAQREVERLMLKYAPEEENDLIDKTLRSVSAGVEKLLPLIRELSDLGLHASLEGWRTEGGYSAALPPLSGIMASGEGSNDVPGDNEDATVLAQFEREGRMDELRARGLDDAVPDTYAKWRSSPSLLRVPSSYERRGYVVNAATAITTAPPGGARSHAVSVLLRERVYMLQSDLNKAVEEIERRREAWSTEDAARKARAMGAYQVIGGTSTKLMMLSDAIQKRGISVLVVEEAAELPEAHLLSCITDSVQHVVLIGDHKQLRPKVSEFHLERRHNLAISTMERLVVSGLRCVTLTMQRRMTPLISDLTKPYYRNPTQRGENSVVIEDHPRTRHKKEPCGVCNPDGVPYRLYFIDHNGEGEKRERQCDDLGSPENPFEAKLVVCIAHYLHNANPKMTISILVPYTGQKLAVYKELDRKKVPQRGKYTGGQSGVRLSTIDDYQGEEDDIIILSLVRTERPGFLRLENRSCVALSRARCALYVVGCCKLLSSACALWKNLEDVCRREGCFGATFPARCNRHPRADLSFGDATVYERGYIRCSEACGESLGCGHVCQGKCHGERPHPNCRQPCERTGVQCQPPRLFCSHACAKKCGEVCGACKVPINHTYTDCGHTVQLQCFQQENIPPCKTFHSAEAACGHFVMASCYDHRKGTAHLQCKELCGKRTDCLGDGHRCGLKCGHKGQCDCRKRITVKMECGHESAEFVCITKKPPSCTATCGKMLYCNHACSGVCGMCSERKIHGHCNKGEKPLVCGHLGKMGCADTTGSCEEPCQFWCGHGVPCDKQSKKHCCSECPRSKCQEPCTWRCPHGSCSRLCWEPCVFVLHGEQKHTGGCWQPCLKKLRCGHQCCGLCGEVCPDFCRECYSLGVKEAVMMGGKVESFYGDHEDVRMGRPLGDEGGLPLLVQMQCCNRFLPASELRLYLSTNMENKVQVHTCPFCRRIIFPDSFRHGGHLLKERLCDARTVVREVKKVVSQSREESRKYARAVVEYLRDHHQVNAARLEENITNTRELLGTVEQQRKSGRANGRRVELGGIWKSFERRCREVSVGEGWIALLRYYLLVTEYVLFSLQKERETWSNAHKLSRAAFSLIRLYESIGKERENGEQPPSGNEVQFCRGNVGDMIPDVCRLAEHLPSVEDSKGAEKLSQRVEWTEILYELSVLTVLTPLEMDIQTVKAFARNGVAHSEVGRAESLKRTFEQVRNTPTPEMLRGIGRALNLVGGHWYKCPNGHFYVVGECGNPAQQAICPECRQRIGGSGYISLPGNTSVGRF